MVNNTLPRHLTLAELEMSLPHITSSPADAGVLEMIVARPQTDERIVLERGQLDYAHGLVGDNWHMHSKSSVDQQLTLMSARVIAMLAQEKKLWALAGDQLYVDLDLSTDNLPPGTRLSIGEAVIEVSAIAHTGCKKFRDRFGADALKFVNSPQGRRLQLRGINARVVQSGAIAVGDIVRVVRGVS